ncbi:MAG: hypothetical protein P1P77_14050 [Spirochaetaceae bacterium]|nr:hypothetical protein [Spirochaetaceae bacterium]
MVSQASIDMTRDEELMNLMARSGCLGNVVGFKSLDERNLALVGKTVNSTAVSTGYRREIEVLRDYGLQTWAAFTLGYDHDTVESVKHTLDFALKTASPSPHSTSSCPTQEHCSTPGSGVTPCSCTMRAGGSIPNTASIMRRSAPGR